MIGVTAEGAAMFEGRASGVTFAGAFTAEIVRYAKCDTVFSGDER